MGKEAGHVVYGAVRLSDEEERLLLDRMKKINEQFPESGITMNNFYDMAFRIGVDIEISAIRKEMEAGKHVKSE